MIRQSLRTCCPSAEIAAAGRPFQMVRISSGDSTRSRRRVAKGFFMPRHGLCSSSPFCSAQLNILRTISKVRLAPIVTPRLVMRSTIRPMSRRVTAAALARPMIGSTSLASA